MSQNKIYTSGLSYDATEEDLEKYFNAAVDGPQHQDLFDRAQVLICKEREISLEVTLLIGCLEIKNTATKMGFDRHGDMADALGLTANMFWKRETHAQL